MLNSFMKHEVSVLCGLAEISVDFLFLNYSYKANGLQHILPETAFHSTYFIKRMHDVFKACFLHESMNQQTSPYCVRYYCLIVFKKRLFAQSIVKLWEEEVH